MTQGGKMSKELPKRFEELGVKELRRAAIEDFAVDVSADDNAKSVVAALTEAGVTWEMYVAQHPEVLPEDKEKRPANVITSPDQVSADSLSVEPAPVVAEPAPVRTAKSPVQEPGDYLIVMERENPLYEVRGYKFTKEHPYQVVSAEDAQYILGKEQGFRMAWPDELRDYYN
jgi:hypothetical protein